MSKFFGELTNNNYETSVSKIGRTELKAHVRGYDCGIKVECREDDFGEQQFHIFLTEGTNNPSIQKTIGLVTYHGKNADVKVTVKVWE